MKKDSSFDRKEWQVPICRTEYNYFPIFYWLTTKKNLQITFFISLDVFLTVAWFDSHLFPDELVSIRCWSSSFESIFKASKLISLFWCSATEKIWFVDLKLCEFGRYFSVEEISKRFLRTGLKRDQRKRDSLNEIIF